MPVALPRWIYPTERCIRCQAVVKLSSHKINTEQPESFVEVHYLCECGNDNAFALGRGYVAAYQKYLDDKKKEETSSEVPPVIS
jgi:hypothetical protein